MTHMVDLDDPTLYPRVDPTGFRDRLRSLAQQCRDAYSQARDLHLPPGHGKIRRVLFGGMGGSAIGGDLLADLATAMGVPLPITTWRDYGLPPWADEETLVVVSSYSGETEETISALHTALERNTPVVLLTAGGTLGRLGEIHGLPTTLIRHRGEPRTALGYGLMVPLSMLEALGLFPPMGDEVATAAELVERLGEEYGVETPEMGNKAKALARLLDGRLPAIYGAGLLGTVARRWKADLNENAKSWAVAEALPEAGHNAATAFELPAATRDSATVLLLHSPLLHPRVVLRYRLVGMLLEGAGVPYTQVEARGVGPLSHLLSQLCLGGWVSYYLAALYGVDPSATPGIGVMKRELARQAEAE